MRRLTLILGIFLGTTLSHADEIVLNDGSTIEWKAILDKGEKYEVMTAKGEKLSIPKIEVREILITKPQNKSASPLTGATFTVKEAVLANEIDIMKLVDIKKDVVRGTWEFVTGGSLVSTDGSPRLIQIPFAPGDEYDLKLTAERKGTDVCSVNIGLVGGGKQFMLVIGGLGQNGLHLVDGAAVTSNPSTYTCTPDPFATGKPVPIVCSVRKESLVVSVNGKTVFTWKEFKRLSLEDYWAVPNKKLLFIGSMGTCGISKIAVVGQGKRLR